MTVNDSGDTGINTGYLTANTLRGLDMPAGIDFFNFETKNVFINTGSTLYRAPTAIKLSASTVRMGVSGAVVGTLTVTDPDPSEVFTYSVNDSRFEVIGNQLKLKTGISIPFSATPVSIPLAITVKDKAGLTLTKAFIIVPV